MIRWLHNVGLWIIIILCNTTGRYSLAQDDKVVQVTPSEFTQNQILRNTNSSLKFNPLIPITAYQNNFDNDGLEIFSLDFNISTFAGIEGKTLHTPHPYPDAEKKDSMCDLTAQIMHPIIIKPNGTLQFDEIVLVEPEAEQTDSDSINSGDFVIVEASTDLGNTWHPLTQKYNSSVDAVWNHIFSKSIINNQSYGKGVESLFKQRNIELIDNINFFEGDTIFIRFRLCSNHVINGWGWAIDNLEIKQDVADDRNLFSENFNIYPNPFEDRLVIDCSNIYGPETVDLILSDQFGRIIYRERQLPAATIRNKEIDVSHLEAGIYILSISDQKYFHKNKKLIKR